LLVIKRIVLVFWAAWLSVVVVTNVLNGLRAVEALPSSFKFVSGNWEWINQVMDPLGAPRGMQGTLFAGAIVWEALAAALFWWAVATYQGRRLTREKPTLYACGCNLALWAAFQVLDEVFLAYESERVHRMIFLNQIATLVLLHVLSVDSEHPGNPKHDVHATL
jgi:hypothetical protein